MKHICQNNFVNYAHRGASEYLPENTMLSFYTGLYMGANGIETDVRKTKDNVLVLFHDDSLLRMTGDKGGVEEYTYKELLSFNVTKNGHFDKIVKLEDFLKAFSFRDIAFAIELKGKGVEAGTAEFLRKYSMQNKTVVTSFNLEFLKTFRSIAPEFEIGYLTGDTSDEALNTLIGMGAEEFCPEAKKMTPEFCKKCHDNGLRVRAWGVYDEDLMRHAHFCGADGMTVNFPDKLTELLKK